MKWWEKELQSCRTGCWGQTQVGELTHGSTGLSSMPLPLSVQTSNAHRLPAPVQSLLRAPPSRASHLAATRASSIHPHTTSLPTFRLRPQSQPPSAWTFPSPPGPTPPHYVPAVHSAFTAPRSRSFHPRRLCASHFLLLRPYSTSPLHFSPTPPTNGSLSGTHSRPGSPARPPPSRRWCGCCSWKGTVALSGCRPARGEPAGTGGEQPRRSPPAPPRPGPQAPPPLPPAAAPAIARPPAELLALLGPTASPTQPPTPAAAAYLPYGAETGPLSPEPSLAYGSPDPSFQPIRRLIFPYQRMIG